MVGENTTSDEAAHIDALIRRLFVAGLDLHGALAHIEPGSPAFPKVRGVINGLDAAIKEVRGMFLHLPPEPVPGGVRTLVVDAVERACANAGGCGGSPTIVFGQNVEAVSEQDMCRHVARLVHEVLSRVPGDRLFAARVEVIADPPRLVAHIDVPAGDVADVAGRTCGGVAVSWHPARSRVRVECRPAGS